MKSLIAVVLAVFGTKVAFGATCADLINPNTGRSDCPGLAYLCNNANYRTLMTQQCPKTCNLCTPAPAPSPPAGGCVDKLNPSTGISDCASSRTYCNDPLYINFMTQQCPKTCGRCSG